MKILLVCDRADVTEKFTAVLTSWAEERDGEPLVLRAAASSVEGRALAQEQAFDAVLLYSPLEGALGDELAVRFSRLSAATVVLILPAKVTGPMRKKLTGKGILVTQTPLKKHEFFSTLAAAFVCSERTRALFEENEQLRAKLEEQKTIERAKILLVECLKLSEDQAHKYIERESMELRESRLDVARRIISTYQS